MTQRLPQRIIRFVAWLLLTLLPASAAAGPARVLLCSGTDGHVALEVAAGADRHEHHDERGGDGAAPRRAMAPSPEPGDDCSHVTVGAPALEGRGRTGPGDAGRPNGGPALTAVAVLPPDQAAPGPHARRIRPPDRTTDQTLRSVRSTVLLI